jgi:hypothetical protein
VILSRDTLCVASEDSLSDIIVQRGIREFFPLLELVRFDLTSPAGMREFADAVEAPGISLTLGIWRQFCWRIVLLVGSSFQFAPLDPLDSNMGSNGTMVSVSAATTRRYRSHEMASLIFPI